MEQFSISVPMSKTGLAMLKASTATLTALINESTPIELAPEKPTPVEKAKPAPVEKATPVETAPTPAPSRGRPKREKPAAVTPAPVVGASAVGEGLDMDDNDELEVEDDELGLTEPKAPAAPAAKKLTLNEDVIPAFRDALVRVNGDKAKLAAVLSEYGIKSVQLIPEAKYSEVMAKLFRLR